MRRARRCLRPRRAPVTRLRHWAGLVVLLVLLGLVVAYHDLTGPQRVCVYAERFLEGMTGGVVHIDAARFDLFEGVRLSGVVLATDREALDAAVSRGIAGRRDSSDGQSDDAADDRVVFTARALHLKLRPFSLITGHLLVPEITAIQPSLRLVKNAQTGWRNWDTLFPHKQSKGKAASQYPLIRLRDVSVHLGWATPSAEDVSTDVALDVTAHVDAADPRSYDIRWRTRGERIEQGRFRLDMAPLRLGTAEGGLPTIPMASVRWAAPASLDRWLTLLDLRGQIRTDSLSYDPAAGSRAEITLEGGSLSIPADEQDRAAPREQRVLAFMDVRGTLRFGGRGVDVDLEGAWRGGTYSLTGRIEAADGVASVHRVDDLGFDVRVEARDIELPPEPDRRTPSETRLIARWTKLADFLEQYKPRGRVDLSFSLARRAGPDQPVEFRGGTLAAHDASAEYFRFPYRLDHVKGRVVFKPDGSVVLDDIVGQHGSARVTVAGTLTAARWVCGFDLDVRGKDVALDDSLYRCLRDTYRGAWDAFAPRGSADIAVTLRRDESKTDQSNPTHTRVEADLRSIAVCYERFPLPAHDVRGRLVIEEETFAVDKLHGRYRDADVELSGTVHVQRGKPPDVALRLRAAGLPIDEPLAEAVPSVARELVHVIGARGRADVEGTLTSGADGIEPDLLARLQLTSVCHRALPLPVRDARATVRVTADAVDIRDFVGVADGGVVTLRGTFARSSPVALRELHVQARRIMLSRELFDVLPPAARHAWVEWRPAGRIDADLLLRHAPPDAPGSVEVSAQLRPDGITISPAHFPLRLQDVRGTLNVSADGVDLVDVQGRIGVARFAAAGGVRWSDAGMNGDIRVSVDSLALDPSIRRALPWRQRRVWDAIQPRGAVDLDVRHFAFRRDADGPLRWTLDARLDARDVDFAGAGTVGGIRGHAEGRAEGQAGGDIVLDATLAVDSLRFGSWPVNAIHAAVRKDAASSTIRFDDLRGELFGGMISGIAQLGYDRDAPTYGFSITAQDMPLARMLAKPNSPAPPRDAAQAAGPAEAVGPQGDVRGTFFLSGTLGDRASRRGGGSVEIRRAQIVKIPLALAILGVLNFALPDENAFHEATADFVLQGDTLTLNPVDLRGNSISLVGGGRLRTTTRELDLTLLAGSPHRLPRLGLLTELAEGAARELMEVHVTGTLREPRVEARPLRSLQHTLDVLRELSRE